MTDCGDNSCKYATKKGGMRTNGGCRCDCCPTCGQFISKLNIKAREHRPWCTTPEWQAPWQKEDK